MNKQLNLFGEEVKKAPLNSTRSVEPLEAPEHSVMVKTYTNGQDHHYVVIDSDGEFVAQDRIGQATEEICEFLAVTHALMYCFHYWCSCSLKSKGKGQGAVTTITRKLYEEMQAASRSQTFAAPPEEADHEGDCTQIRTVYTKTESVISMIKAKQCDRTYERPEIDDYIILAQRWLRTHRNTAEVKLI